MVYHYAEAGTIDQSEERWGFTPPNVDWMPVRRRIDTGIEIHAPLERVRAVLVDGARYAEWNPYLVRIDGPIEAGAEIVAEGRLEGGRSLSMPVRVLAVGDDGMRWQGGLPDAGELRTDHGFALEALGAERTRLHHWEVFTGARVDELVIPNAAAIRTNFERMNEALRRRCEQA